VLPYCRERKPAKFSRLHEILDSLYLYLIVELAGGFSKTLADFLENLVLKNQKIKTPIFELFIKKPFSRLPNTCYVIVFKNGDVKSCGSQNPFGKIGLLQIIDYFQLGTTFCCKWLNL